MGRLMVKKETDLNPRPGASIMRLTDSEVHEICNRCMNGYSVLYGFVRVWACLGETQIERGRTGMLSGCGGQ